MAPNVTLGGGGVPHDRWHNGIGDQDRGLQSEYAARISNEARAKRHLEIAPRPRLAQQRLPTPCVLGRYALDMDPSGAWLDFAHRDGFYFSLSAAGGKYRYQAGHNAGLLVAEFGAQGSATYVRDRGHRFAAIAKARAGPSVKAGKYRFGKQGKDGQWHVSVEASGVLVISFLKAHSYLDRERAHSEPYWADPEHLYGTTHAPRRQAGQLVLASDGGLRSEGRNRRIVQKMVHGTVALHADDLDSCEVPAEQRKTEYKKHPHLGGPTPYYRRDVMDPSLRNPAEPGGDLLQVFGKNADMFDSVVSRVEAKNCAIKRLDKNGEIVDPGRPPWALETEPAPRRAGRGGSGSARTRKPVSELEQAWGASLGGTAPPQRKTRQHARAFAPDLQAQRDPRQTIASAAPRWL